MITNALFLLISLFLSHWLADFTHLSRPWMLSAKRFGKPITPIVAHATVHALLTFLVVWLFSKSSYALSAGLFMLLTHSVIDILKGRLNGWFPSLQDPSNAFHWYVFGGDQTLHLIVIALITFGTYNP